MSGKADMRALGVDRLFGVDGKTVLVTGGARGIGLMIAAGFVANGATWLLYPFPAPRDRPETRMPFCA